MLLHVAALAELSAPADGEAVREEELTKREREQSDADTIDALVAEFSRISSARSAHPICSCNSMSTSLLSNETSITMQIWSQVIVRLETRSRSAQR